MIQPLQARNSRTHPKIPPKSFVCIWAMLAAVAPPALWGDDFIDAGRGPVPLRVPLNHDLQTPTPLVVLLHGYGASAALQEAYMRFGRLVDEFGFLYLLPDGAIDAGDNRFWNATDACCDFGNTGVDDSAYLQALVAAVAARYHVDDRRIYFIGHSNGGFMAYRMACDHAGMIAAIVSMAGATYLDPVACAPAAPVHVLQIHGTADGSIAYAGGCIVRCYPGAQASVQQWARYDGCSSETVSPGPSIDLVRTLAGNETTVLRYTDACLPVGSAELWTIAGGAHTPQLSVDFNRLVIEWLWAHPKPAAERTAGDLNCDGAFNVDDIGPFGLSLLAPADYAAAYPACDAALADLNADGRTNGADIAAMAMRLASL